MQLLNAPKQYAQLHRDTSIHMLTQTTSVLNGKIHYQDSPLIVAVKNGHVAIIDEADKAPVSVVRILKTLGIFFYL